MTYWAKFLINRLYFLKSFRFTENWEGSTDGSHGPAPHSSPVCEHLALDGTFVTVDGPILVHWDSLCVAQSKSFDQCMIPCISPSQHHTGGSLLCPKNSCVPPVHPSPCPKPMRTTDLFTVSIVLPFPECHVVGIIRCLVFYNWLLSPSNMHLRFFHVFSWLDSLFLFILELESVVWRYYCLFIHSWTKGHLVCFQILSLMNKLL